MESAGEKLKKLRLEKGLSLEEAHKKTKIHLNILKAIEGDTITNLNPIYLKGFLKIYCNFLGVNPNEYISGYREIKAESSSKEIVKETARESRKTNVLRETAIKIGSFKAPKKIRTAAILILAVIFLAVGLFNIGKFISSRRKNNLARQERLSAMPALMETKKEKQKTKIPSASLKPSAAFTKITLVISAKERSFVQVKADGRTVFKGDLAKKRSESYSANEKIELIVGNAGAVELIVNGTRFSNIGKRGQSRKNIVITKEGLNLGR